ncbi:MAG: hypothetical protein OEL53_09545 [Rhodospirillales bacterium]|nr:hypothetical protein [Rhodospirillales bacterium]
MRIEPFESPQRSVQRQEAVKADSAPQPEAKPVDPVGFISPVIHVDSQAGVAILQYRDNATGEVTAQIPSETVVKRYRAGEAVAHPGQTASAPPPTGGETSAAPAPVSSGGGESGSGGGGGSSSGGDTGGGTGSESTGS